MKNEDRRSNLITQKCLTHIANYENIIITQTRRLESPLASSTIAAIIIITIMELHHPPCTVLVHHGDYVCTFSPLGYATIPKRIPVFYQIKGNSRKCKLHASKRDIARKELNG